MKKVQDLLSDSKHFCVLPWCHLHAWPNKDVMLCCIADSTKPVSKVVDGESILELVNSDRYKEVRLAMLNDEPIPECERCYALEAVGEFTMRKSHLGKRGESLKEVIESTNADGSIDDFTLEYMDMRFSNKCNFRCRSCGPACSSSLGNEIIQDHGLEHFKEYFGPQAEVSIGEKFFEELTPHLKDVTEVYFAGGESLLHDEPVKCLDYWIEHELTDQINVEYTTNLSTLTYRGRDMIELWNKFPNVAIWASLDAMGEEAEFIRAGTKWEKIVENMERIKNEAPHVQLQITPTISIWNVYTFPKFFDWLIENEYISIGEHPNIPRFNLVTFPTYANIQILPDHVRAELITMYRKYAEKYCSGSFNGFFLILNALENGQYNKDLLKEFMQKNIKFDMFRNESLAGTMPEIFEVYLWLKSN